MSDILTTSLLLMTLTIVAALPIVGYFTKRAADIFEPIYWASAYFFLLFVARSIYTLILGSEFLGPPPLDSKTMESLNLGLLYSLASFVVFLFGYYSRVGRVMATSVPAIPIQWSIKRIRIFGPLILGLGVAAYLLLVQFHGGWAAYLVEKQKTLTAAGQGYLLIGSSLITYIYVVFLTRVLTEHKAYGFTFGVLLPIVLAVGFFSGSKGAFLIPILSTLIVTHYVRRNIRFRTVLLFIVFVMFSLPVFNLYRSIGVMARVQDINAMIIADQSGEGVVRHIMSRFYGIDSLTLLIRDTPEVMDYQLGRTIAPLAIAWIPRQLWGDKPTVSFGKVFAETYMADYFSGTGTSASPTILGEAYLNFHIGGMLWIALVSGMVIRAFYEYCIRLHFGAPAVFIYSLVFLYLFTFWEVSIAGFIAQQTISLLVLVFIAVIMGQRKTVRGCCGYGD